MKNGLSERSARVVRLALSDAQTEIFKTMKLLRSYDSNEKNLLFWAERLADVHGAMRELDWEYLIFDGGQQ
jgi:hypothetical protein